jgi:hypothetical protein
MEIVNGVGQLTDKQLAKIPYTIPISDGQYDLRVPISKRAIQLLKEVGIPITPRLAGTCALDFAVEGISKTTSIKYVLENSEVLAAIGLKAEDLISPTHCEVWGDKYSIIHGGTDRHMSEALPPTVRSIDFRKENPDELPEGYNIVMWNGRQHLHHGLLEYLQSRHAN